MKADIAHENSFNDVICNLGSISALHHRAFDAEPSPRELPAPPLPADSLIAAAPSLGFRVEQRSTPRSDLAALTMLRVALVWEKAATDSCSGAASRNHHPRFAKYLDFRVSKALTWSAA
jgi:hypothetical protein